MGGISTYAYALQSPLLFADANGNQAGEITGHAVATGPLPPGFDASTVVCNGLGDLIYFQSPVLTQEQIKCFVDCDREHEMIHRRDFLKSNPNICKGHLKTHQWVLREHRLVRRILRAKLKRKLMR